MPCISWYRPMGSQQMATVLKSAGNKKEVILLDDFNWRVEKILQLGSIIQHGENTRDDNDVRVNV